MKGLYIITGTSRGIGCAVAARLLETGSEVVGVSRTPSPLAGEPGFCGFRASVTDTESIESVFEDVRAQLADGGFDMLCLLNNAAVLDPMGAIEGCDVQDIQHHVDVNLTAPIQLTARFIACFGDLELRKKVVHMTSGAAHAPIPDMSLYCTVKAAISMFTACLGREQAGKAGGFEVAAISPGMVETDMQKVARARDPDGFRPSDMFRSAKATGAVQEVDVAARTICEILEARTEMGQTVSVTEW